MMLRWRSCFGTFGPQPLCPKWTSPRGSAPGADVVQALEQGALYALPPWPETCRVVNAYGALLNLDVRPLLRRIYAQLEAGIVELQPKPMPDVPVMTPPETGDFGFAPANAAGAVARPTLSIFPGRRRLPQAPPPQKPLAYRPRPSPAAASAPAERRAVSLSRRTPGRTRKLRNPIRKPGPAANRRLRPPGQTRRSRPRRQRPSLTSRPPRRLSLAPQQAQAPQPQPQRQPQPQPMPPRQRRRRSRSRSMRISARRLPSPPAPEPDKAKRRRPRS